MSQNRTIIPEYNASETHDDGMSSFYNRSSDADIDRSKTYIPGIYRSAAQEIADEQAPQAKGELKFQDRTIVGALFSISRFATGEIFPVYIGRNTIGSDKSSDIFLPEATVSPNHAVLLVRAVENIDGNHELKIYLTDYDSEYGTMIGNVALEYEKLECHDRDVISVGNGYKFLFCLFDAEKHKLFASKVFRLVHQQDTEEETVSPTFMPQQDMSMTQGSQQNVQQPVSMEDEFSFYAPTKKDEGDHSTNKTVLL